MCILFLHTNASPLRGGFRLILAVNRDEAYKRPTLPAHFWTEAPTVIGGRDMEPGREGGTWLAMSKAGKIAALLNVLQQPPKDVPLLGRGNLVPDYVLGLSPPTQYLNTLSLDSDKYNPFNFLAINISSDEVQVAACSNAGNTRSPINQGAGTVGHGNSLIGQPFKKVTEGTNRFNSVVQDFGSTEKKDELQEHLLSLLRWDKQHFPDEEMMRRGSHLPEDRLPKLSSVFVKLHPTYGTRTHTVILVDADNNVDYIEWTMVEPIDPDAISWSKVEKNFKLSI